MTAQPSSMEPCPTCGYPLPTVKEAVRCPECGRRWSRSQLFARYRLETRRMEVGSAWVAAAGCCALGACVTVLLLMMGIGEHPAARNLAVVHQFALPALLALGATFKAPRFALLFAFAYPAFPLLVSITCCSSPDADNWIAMGPIAAGMGMAGSGVGFGVARFGRARRK